MGNEVGRALRQLAATELLPVRIMGEEAQWGFAAVGAVGVGRAA